MWEERTPFIHATGVFKSFPLLRPSFYWYLPSNLFLYILFLMNYSYIYLFIENMGIYINADDYIYMCVYIYIYIYIFFFFLTKWLRRLLMFTPWTYIELTGSLSLWFQILFLKKNTQISKWISKLNYMSCKKA